MNRLKELRQKKNWTTKYLSKFLHVNCSTISKYENGKIPLTDVTIMKAALLFDVTSDYLLGLTSTSIKLNKEFITSEDDKKVLSYYNKLNEENKDSTKGYMVKLYREQLYIPVEVDKKRTA